MVPFSGNAAIMRAILEAGLQRQTVDAFAAFHRLAQARQVEAAEALDLNDPKAAQSALDGNPAYTP